MKYFILISILLFASSCGIAKKKQASSLSQTSQSSIEVTTEMDTLVELLSDSSSFTAQLEVDSIGTISISNSHSVVTSTLDAPRVRIIDNIITVDCYKKAQELYLQWKSKYVATQATSKNVEYVTLEVERPMGKLISVMATIGVISLLALAIFITQKIIKHFKLK